jgi:hypothetical protein
LLAFLETASRPATRRGHSFMTNADMLLFIFDPQRKPGASGTL